MNVAGHAMLQMGSWDQAFAWFRRSKEANPNYQASYFNLGAALRSLVDLRRPIPQSRPATGSIPRIPSPASAPPGLRGAMTRRT
jgi:hypothetical protein